MPDTIALIIALFLALIGLYITENRPPALHMTQEPSGGPQPGPIVGAGVAGLIILGILVSDGASVGDFIGAAVITGIGFAVYRVLWRGGEQRPDERSSAPAASAQADNRKSGERAIEGTKRVEGALMRGRKVVGWCCAGGLAIGTIMILSAFGNTSTYGGGPNEGQLVLGIMVAAVSLVVVMVYGAVLYMITQTREQFSEAYWHGRRKEEAKKAAAGEKPFGEPWAATHGGAFFMAPEQITAAGHGFDQVRGDLPVLGNLGQLDKRGNLTNLAIIHHNDPAHLLTVAPTRSGKGTSAVIPNLLTYRGSVIVNDIKGENFDITARRRHAMGQNVIKFAPLSTESHRWNPMEFLATSGDEAWEDAGLLAELLLVPTGGAEAQYFEDRARNFLTAVILHVASTRPVGDGRNLWQVRHLLTLPRSDFDALLDEMADSGHTAVKRAANILRDAEDKQREQIMATLDSQMAVWDSERLAAVMSGASDFSLADAKRESLSIFFQVPPERLKQYRPVLRVFFGMAVREMVRTPDKPDIPVLFMLDEFPALGRMGSIEDAVPYLAGYGARLWLFAQDLAQLRKTYGEGTDSILANCACWQFFGVQDASTARLVSEMTGQTTVSTVSRSAEAGFTTNTTGPQQSVSDAARPLMTTDEAANLDPNWELVFINGIRPIHCEKLPYFGVPMFEGLYDEAGDGPMLEEVSWRPRGTTLPPTEHATSGAATETATAANAQNAASEGQQPPSQPEPAGAGADAHQATAVDDVPAQARAHLDTAATDTSTAGADTAAPANDDPVPDTPEKNDFVALAEGTLADANRSAALSSAVSEDGTPASEGNGATDVSSDYSVTERAYNDHPGVESDGKRQSSKPHKTKPGPPPSRPGRRATD